MRRLLTSAIVFGALVLGTLVAGIGTAGACSCAQDSGAFIGRVVERDGSAVTYTVERVQPNLFGGPSIVHPPPVAGRRAVVYYEHGEQQFLHVGSRYSARVWWLSGIRPTPHFFSAVETGDLCCGGTMHIDGTAIDRSLWRQSKVRHAALVAVAALAGIGAVVTLFAARKRRRQTRNAELLRWSLDGATQ
jgi:hypothetical protein